MDNYAIALQNAKRHFCTYDPQKLVAQSPAWLRDGKICTCFLGEDVEIEVGTGEITVGGQPANFCQALTVFDWLCDRKKDAWALWEYCPITSLPGVLVSGSGLVIRTDALAEKIDRNPEAFERACRALGGAPMFTADIAYELPVFPDMGMALKFYHADEDFPASLTFLWDQNILCFIRYETVYYLASCVRDRLEKAM